MSDNRIRGDGDSFYALLLDAFSKLDKLICNNQKLWRMLAAVNNAKFCGVVDLAGE